MQFKSITALFLSLNSLCLRVGFISSHLTANRLFPVNPWAITGPPKISFLLEAKSMTAFIIKPRLILVMHTDDFGWNITSNQQGQMFVQNLNMTVSKPNVIPGQIRYCTPDCIPVDLMFWENFPTNTQVWNCLTHRNDCQQRGVIWVTYWCSNETHTRSGTSVTRRSSVPPRALVGPTTYWSQTDKVAMSKPATPWQFVVVEPNSTLDDGHSNPPRTGQRHEYPQSARKPLTLVNNQKSGHLGQSCGKGWKIKVLSHTTHPKKKHFATSTLKFGLAKCSVTISYVCSHPSGPRHLAPAQQDRVTESGNQYLWHVTHIWDQSLWA